MATCKYLKENLRPPFKFQNVCKNLFIRETHRFHHFSRLILQLIYKISPVRVTTHAGLLVAQVTVPKQRGYGTGPRTVPAWQCQVE